MSANVDKSNGGARTPGLKWWVIAGGALFLVGVVGVITMARFAEPLARKWLIGVLSDRFDARVDVRDLRLSFFPSVSASTGEITVYKNGEDQQEPLIHLKGTRTTATFWGLLWPQKHVRSVVLDGLDIHLPSLKAENIDRDKAEAEQKHRSPLVIDELTADGSTLVTRPKPGKAGLTFVLEKLRIHSVSLYNPIDFTATLTNPKPPGKIETQGYFGPWHTVEPNLTPVAGKYRFSNADLSVFKGIAGTLSSNGSFRGPLEQIVCDGETDTPDFMLVKGVFLTLDKGVQYQQNLSGRGIAVLIVKTRSNRIED